ncbi:uncharacterized protein LOC129576422 [Sitodiplosis mosellana]|uniref:uncharacterized protein LOC129576422 n=1 Tax=Sitodiplosis mosellana TaxID=263140 RepID=UPI002443E7F1|nr:uncharacterized protein LOC129576422 [Sitodiplosis mosellana]
MNSKLLEHLSGRPIAPIANVSEEKHNRNALKIMCILDYKLEKSGWYREMSTMKKRLMQLMNIHSFGTFKYIKYSLAKEAKIHGKVLKCKRCEIIGPYLVVLEHMAINHDMHASAVLCMFCEKDDLQAHNTSDSLETCYNTYLDKHLSGTYFPDGIVKFYDLLKKLARTLGVLSRRSKEFRNILVDSTETIPLEQADDSMSNQIVVSFPKKRTYKDTDSRPMEMLFQEAMIYFHKDHAPDYIDDTLSVNATRPNQFMPNLFASDLNQSSNIHTRMNNGNDPTTFSMPRSFSRYDSSQMSSPYDLPSSSSQFPVPPPLTLPELRPMPLFGISPEESHFGNFISSVLNNIQDGPLKKRAKLEIKSIIYKYSAEDVAKQMGKTQNSDESSTDD